MPVPPKSPDKRQRPKTGKAPKRDLTLLPSRLSIPAPREGLGQAMVAEWDALWRSDMGRMLSETDVPALRRLFHCESRP